MRAAHARLIAETGVELHALGEIEFFLGTRVGDAEAYGANERGYHASSPFVFGEALRRKAMVHLADMGVAVKYGHAEVGYVEADAADSRVWEQHEIELWLQPAARGRRRGRADAVGAAQPRAARRHAVQLRADGAQGPRGQRHALPFRAESGRGVPAAHRADGNLTPVAKWLIGGLVEHGAP